MKNASTGTGLIALAVAIVVAPIVHHSTAPASASPAASTASTAVVAAASVGQVAPTIVWYGVAHNGRFVMGTSNCQHLGCQQSFEYSVLVRAWSDGTVEAKKICTGDSCGAGMSASGWTVVNSPNQGFASSADLNFDEQVDGADLGTLLALWGAAPRHDIPESACPLALVNP